MKQTTEIFESEILNWDESDCMEFLKKNWGLRGFNNTGITRLNGKRSLENMRLECISQFKRVSQETNPKAIIGSGVEDDFKRALKEFYFEGAQRHIEEALNSLDESDKAHFEQCYNESDAVFELSNNYSRLRDSNEELLEVLELAKDEFSSHWDANDEGSSTNKLISKIQAAINKAKKSIIN